MQHGRYWSCSPMADWIRGRPKIGAGTSSEWYIWGKEAKAAHPFRFWVAEEALGKIQNFIGWPGDRLHAVQYYCANRWLTRSNSLTAHPKDIKPGNWCDLSERYLLCMFNELRDFVEVESAHMNCCWSDEAKEKYGAPKGPFSYFRRRAWRSPEAGLAYLEWASKLVHDEDMGVGPEDKLFGKPTLQAENAVEIGKLYDWWVNVYPNRPDPHTASGWSALCGRRRLAMEHGEDGFMFADKTPEEKKETRRILDLSSKLEKQYENEDTKMMIRLVKIRKALWT